MTEHRGRAEQLVAEAEVKRKQYKGMTEGERYLGDAVLALAHAVLGSSSYPVRGPTQTKPEAGPTETKTAGG